MLGQLCLIVSTSTLREHGLSISGGLYGFQNGHPSRLSQSQLDALREVSGRDNLRRISLKRIPGGDEVHLIGYVSSVNLRRKVSVVLYFPYKASYPSIQNVLPKLIPPRQGNLKFLVTIGNVIKKQNTSKTGGKSRENQRTSSGSGSRTKAGRNRKTRK